MCHEQKFGNNVKKLDDDKIMQFCNLLGDKRRWRYNLFEMHIVKLDGYKLKMCVSNVMLSDVNILADDNWSW
jgi:ribosomal protein L28